MMSQLSLQEPNATASISGLKRYYKPKPDNSMPSFEKHATPPSRHAINHGKKVLGPKYPALTVEDADAGVWPCMKGMKGPGAHHRQRYNTRYYSSGSSAICIPGPSTLAPAENAIISRNPTPSSSGSCIPGPSTFAQAKKPNISRDSTPSGSENGPGPNYQSTQRNHIFEIYNIQDDRKGKGVERYTTEGDRKGNGIERHYVEPILPSNTHNTNAETTGGYTMQGGWKGKGIERPHVQSIFPSVTNDTNVEIVEGYAMQGDRKGKGIERPYVEPIFPSTAHSTNAETIESYTKQGDRKGKGIERPHVQSIFPSTTHNTNADAAESYATQGDRKGTGIERPHDQPTFHSATNNTNVEANSSRQKATTYPRMGQYAGPSNAAMAAHHTLGSVHGGTNYATHPIRRRPRTPYPRNVRSGASDITVSDTSTVEDMAPVEPISIADELAAKLDVLESETGYRIPVTTEVSNVFQAPQRKNRVLRRIRNVLRAVFVL